MSEHIMIDSQVDLSEFSQKTPSGSTFETVKRETVYNGPIFTVHHDCVRMPAGSIVTRDVVDHKGAVAIVALDDDNNVIMIEQFRYPLGYREWEIPAGLLDIEGEEPHLAAARELREEAGIVAKQWETLTDLATSPGFSNETIRVYLARGLTTVSRPTPHDDEEAELWVARVPLTTAINAIFSGHIINAIAIAGIFAAHYVITAESNQQSSLLRSVTDPWKEPQKSDFSEQSRFEHR